MKKRLLFILLPFFYLFPIMVLAESSYIVVDINSGRIIASQNMYEKHLIASTTKIMTCIEVLENTNIDKEIIVGEEVKSMYGTNIYIKDGEKMLIKDLLYGLMLRSGNDAAITLAYQTLGEEKFLYEMNQKAQELGMKDTLFENPHGLDDKTQNYSTAYDMALLGRYAYQNNIYREIISTKKYNAKSSLQSYTWINRMSLLSKYKYCLGGKNGYTPKAGKSLVSYAQKDNITLMIVSLNDPNIYDTHQKLYEKYFSLYKDYTIIDSKTFFLESTFTDGNLYTKKSFHYLLMKNEIDDITTLIELYPVTRDKKAGKIIIRLKEEIIGTVDIYKKEKEKKKEKSFFQKMKSLLIR